MSSPPRFFGPPTASGFIRRLPLCMLRPRPDHSKSLAGLVWNLSRKHASVGTTAPARLFSVAKGPTLRIFKDLQTLGSRKKVNSPIFSGFRTFATETPGVACHLPASFPAARFPRSVYSFPMKEYRFVPLNSLFSIPAFHFSSLFFTLAEISRLFADSYEKCPGIGPSHIPILERLSSQISVPFSTSLLRYVVTCFGLVCARLAHHSYEEFSQ